MNQKISVAIVAKDRPEFLKKTIESTIFLAEEIIIFDIGLNIPYKEIIFSKKIKIKKIDETVPYVEKIREKLKDHLKFNWVLFLDPDEIFPINTLKKIPSLITQYDCLSFPRKNIIFGQWIKHSRFWPDYQPRLFKKNKVFWLKEIHSKPKILGKEYLFEATENNAIIHYNYQNLNHWFEKFQRYAQAEAKIYLEKNKKLNLFETVKKALSEFISRYFASDGYKDGALGITLATLQMFYYFIVYFYYLELKKFQIKDEDNQFSYSMRNFFKDGFFETNFWIYKKLPNLNPLKKLKNKITSFLIKIID